MRYEWDPEKASSNHQKHGVRFSDAVAVFEDEHALAIEEAHPDEERHINVGMDAFGRVLVIVYTWRGDDTIRLISARKATRAERNRGALDPIPTGKTRITIRLDTDVLDWFRDQVERAGGGNYQTLINAALREYVGHRQEPLEDTLRRVLREELRRSA